MERQTIRNVYKRLCFLSVFSSLQEKEPLKSFFAYCESEGECERAKRYARFVQSVYENANGDLTAFVSRVVFEDENVFIKRVASGEEVSDILQAQTKKELEILSAFASLCVEDFALDLGVLKQEIPAFSSFNAYLGASFEERLQNIHKHGFGIFASHSMFRLNENCAIEPIESVDKIRLHHFIGYQQEREQIVENTKALLKGKPAANALLCGDAGTGKSSTVKAIVNEFFQEGLRLIELRKDQLRFLPVVMEKIAKNPLKFIIFIDDLAFNKSNDDFSMLKAVLEGSASAKSENAVIYATSNRRHIIKESFSERDGDDVHRNDTLQETLSLSERFALVVRFQKPDKNLYLTIVEALAKRENLAVDEELFIRAEAYALRKGNRSARCAEQFIKSLL